MTQFYRYKDEGGAFDINLGAQAVRLGSISGFTEAAELGDVGASSIEIDDPSATVGNSNDAILGKKTLIVEEWAAPVNNRRIFTGYFGDRRYSRADSLRTGVSRRISADLVDVNAILGSRVISGSDGNRPAETVGARLVWLIASTYAVTNDLGYVIYPTTLMDASDYRGQTALEVLTDCAMAVRYNFFNYSDEAANGGLGQLGLFFDNPNTSTAYSTSTKISNVLADVDSSTVWAPFQDASLTRSPINVASGAYEPYASGAVFVTRAATAAAYARQDRTVADSNVKTAAVATTRANDFLRQNATESDRITCSVQFPAANVNDIRAGQRMQVKFSHLPGYEADTWVRVLRRTVTQTIETPDYYIVQYELSPMEQPCSSATDLNLAATVTVDTARGSGRQWQRPADSNDNNVVTFSQIDNGFADFVTYLKSDLGAAYTVQSFNIIDRGDTDAMPSGTHDGNIYYSTDGITLVAIPYTFSGAYAAYTTGGATLTFSAPVTARYFYIKASNGGAGAFINRCDIETWAIVGCS